MSLLSLLSAPGALFAQAAPLFTRAADSVHLTLTPAMERALHEHASTFSLWQPVDYVDGIMDRYESSDRQAASVVVADFNGDGAEDVVLMGHTEDTELLLALVSEGSAYQLVEIDRSPLGRPMGADYTLITYLLHVPPGPIESHYEEEPLILENPAFELVYAGKAAVLYYYADGRFHMYTTAD